MLDVDDFGNVMEPDDLDNSFLDDEIDEIDINSLDFYGEDIDFDEEDL
jgi:hypothetical protein